MDDLLLKQLESQLDDLINSRVGEKTTKNLGEKSSEAKEKQRNYADELKEQRIKHRDEMLKLVRWLTVPTFIAVLVVVIGQVVKTGSCGNLDFCLKIVGLKELSDTRLSIILGGFLAEILLLPKIILTGLFDRNTE